MREFEITRTVDIAGGGSNVPNIGPNDRKESPIDFLRKKKVNNNGIRALENFGSDTRKMDDQSCSI